MGVSHGRDLTGVHLMGVYLTGVHLMGVCLMGVHLTGVHLRMLPFLLSHTYVGPGLMQHFSFGTTWHSCPSGPPQLHLRCRTKVLAFMTVGRAGEVLEGKASNSEDATDNQKEKQVLSHARQVARSKKREARSKDDLQDEARWTGHS